jgi:ATP-dependent helicase HrpA
MPFTPAPPSALAHLLPVYTHETELIAALRRHQVVVVQGPTGCGKTTQIPQMILRAGLTEGIIGVTQPRRIAAVSVSWRIAEEQDVVLGQEVGFTIRFDDKTSQATRIQLMTDGILLQEARKDPDFSRYGVLIIDEAHERTLNIDFLLGLLHGVLQRRPDLRVIVSSATIQPERFVEFFRTASQEDHVPVVKIDARPHPVEVVYHPLDSGHPDDVADAIANEVAVLHKGGHPGHVLAFLPGEDAIKRTATAIARQSLRDLVVLPLYGALTREEQERVFEPFAGRRKVILATNIAETSITIDDTRYVIDTGQAKVPRVSARTGIMVLREEGISRASADQRMGRAGRTAPGTCIRLYPRQDFLRRQEFTDEEITRLDLSEVVLRLIDLGVREVEEFPFPTPPQPRRMQAALESLEAMGAVDRGRRLTDVGRKMVPFPLTPALARMVVEAGMRFPDVVDEVLVVAAFTSTRQPQMYPAGREDAARKAHATFAQPLGDAVTAVKMVRGWQQAEDREGYCRRWFLDPSAMAFIASAHNQLAGIAERMGILRVSGGDPVGIVRSVAAGFAGQILANRGRHFEGPGEDRIFVHPASTLYGTSARFVVAAEIVVNQRAYARQVSLLKSAWVAELRPQFAERFGVRSEKAHKDEGIKAGPTPGRVQLGTVSLEVDSRKGRPRVDLPYEALEALQGLTAADLPPGAAAWQARLVVGEHIFATGTPLGALLATLPLLPLPKPGADLRCSVPEGALLELDRNQHTLARHLPALLQPMLPSHGKRPGWVMLVANGGGGYWFEVGMDWREVLETSLTSLEDLQQALPDEDPLQPEVEKRLEEVRPRLEAVQEALQSARKSRRG